MQLMVNRWLALILKKEEEVNALKEGSFYHLERILLSCNYSTYINTLNFLFTAHQQSAIADIQEVGPSHQKHTAGSLQHSVTENRKPEETNGHSNLSLYIYLLTLTNLQPIQLYIL
jgi:hypothetical protein